MTDYDKDTDIVRRIADIRQKAKDEHPTANTDYEPDFDPEFVAEVLVDEPPKRGRPKKDSEEFDAIGVRISSSMRQMLEEDAAYYERSVTASVRFAIRQYLADRPHDWED
jgi:hypothetical protein